VAGHRLGESTVGVPREYSHFTEHGDLPVDHTGGSPLPPHGAPAPRRKPMVPPRLRRIAGAPRGAFLKDRRYPAGLRPAATLRRTARVEAREQRGSRETQDAMDFAFTAG